MDLRDLIDLDFLQTFQDNFALCVGVGALAEDSRGNALTNPSCFSNLCMNMIRGTYTGQRRCEKCDLIAGEEAARSGKPVVYHCHAGLVDFVAPIMLEGEQIGSIFGGQILTEPPDEQHSRQIAADIGIHPDEFIKEIRKIPIMPIEKVQTAANVLLSVADTFSKMAYQQLKLQERNRELVLANSRLNNIFKTMSDGVLIIDNDGNITKTNKIAEQIFSKPSSALINQSIRDLVGNNAPCTERILGRQESYNDIEILVDGGIGRIHCFSSGTPIVDDQGVLSGGVIILRPMEKVQKLINRFSGAQASFKFSNIIGQSQTLLKTINLASMAARGKANIMLEGESGTGKEVFAQAIHNQSPRSNGPFIAVNCGAIPRELIGSELFGYADGAFTGAKRGGRPGKFELASGGTLFLDEIGDMPLDQQVALLRVLQERRLTRIGDDKVIDVDVRIICATNKNLDEEVKKGRFRQDLYYRLNVVPIKIPPLRERKEDIPLLFNYMLKTINQDLSSRIKAFDPEVMRLLKEYDWPGNVRELQNMVERIVNINNDGVVKLEHLPASFKICNLDTEAELSSSPPINKEVINERKKIKQRLNEQESARIIDLLNQHGGNISQVAREMKISRTTLYKKMQKYEINN